MPVYFPHLNQGIGSQFPMRRTIRYRTVVNANDLSTTLRASDPGARRIAWWLRFQGLGDNEIASIQELFRTVRGPLDPFVFVDPEGNLFAESEDLSKPIWQKSAGLTVSPSATAPDETASGFVIAAPVIAGEISQTIDAPSSYRWTLSVYAQGEAGSEIEILFRSTSGEKSRKFALTNAWKRYSFGGQFWSSGSGVEAGIRVAGSSSAEVSGLQLESQLAPSSYKRTGAHGGVFQNARFSQDSIRVTTIAPNCHQVNLIVIAPLPD